MRAFALAAGFFAASAVAGPIKVILERQAAGKAPCPEEGTCMSFDEAQKVADNFGELIADLEPAAARAYLTRDFTDYSASVNTLINDGCTGPVPLNEATFTNRRDFIVGQGAQPPNDYEQLNIWHTCDTVIVRWRTTVAPDAPNDVTGIFVAETVYTGNDDEPYKIQTVYSEFDSGSWLVDDGTFEPTCPA